MKLFSNTKALMGIVIGLLSAIIATSVIYIATDDKGIPVPDFKDQMKTDVEDWIKEQEVNPESVHCNYEFDEEKETDTVLSQSIKAGEVLKKDGILEITLSNGPDPDMEFTLPDFKGMDRKAVVKWFTDNGFTNVTYAFSPVPEDSKEEIKKDEFLKCSAKAGDQIKRSDRITVTFATSDEDVQEEITVPDFATYTKANISAWGASNGVTIIFRTKTDESKKTGSFLSQSVKAGTKVKKGSSIIVTLAGGKAINVTDYTGKTKNEAASWASTNGIRAVYQEYYSDSAKAGVILSQNPSSGTIQQGGTVTFAVSIGKVSVEDYTGRTLDAFRSYINGINAGANGSAKLKISASEKKGTGKKAGTILSQSASGTVSTGTAITVEVAADEEKKEEINSTPVPQEVTIDPGLYKAGASYSALVNAVNAANRNGGSFNLTSSNQNSDSVASGKIISCTKNGNSISCTVSSGPASKPGEPDKPQQTTITVPDFTGMTVDEANAKASSLGLVLTQLPSSWNDMAAGKIYAQSRSAGTSVSKDDNTIGIKVSKGPQPTPTPAPTPTPTPAPTPAPTPDAPAMLTMPNINDAQLAIMDGRTYDQNVAYLRNLFLNAGFKDSQLVFAKEDTSNTSLESGLSGISPAASGQQVSADTVVTITIKDPGNQ